jgi:hypothetical protein
MCKRRGKGGDEGGNRAERERGKGENKMAQKKAN